jgi:branched-chain amino acid transport system ATP-binding protein
MQLSINNLSAFYDKPDKLALDSISMSITQGEIVSILGPNGAGKSTVLKSIFNEVKIKTGEIIFEDIPITGLETNRLAHLGICLVPEGRRVFASMTVEENLDMGGFILTDNRKLTTNKDNVFQFFPILEKYRHHLAGHLSGGEQQMLALGRALMLEPKLLLMDEPSLGLAPQIVDHIYEKIKAINKSKVTIILVEQNVRKALEIADRAYVLNLGKIDFNGTPKQITGDSRLRELYFGGPIT